LIDIGVAGYQIATAVKGVVAQRLLRRRCSDCDGAGCSACDDSGHRGRLAVAEVLVGSPEFERRVAAGASTEAIAEAARLGGCATLWESGVDLVRRGETTMDELRRVAAEPVRVVTEPAPTGEAPAVRVGWRGARPEPDAARLKAELTAAAAAVGSHVQVVDLETDAGIGSDPLDALVVDGPTTAGGALRTGSPLVVALARDATPGDHVHTLARDADLVMSAGVHGRILLATILALLRWRSR
jgi:hypothetical protein